MKVKSRSEETLLLSAVCVNKQSWSLIADTLLNDCLFMAISVVDVTLTINDHPIVDML